MDTSKNVKNDEVKKEVTKVDEKPTHRYVCEACSGVAFYGTVGGEVKKTPSKCQTCFAPLGVIKTENFIKL